MPPLVWPFSSMGCPSRKCWRKSMRELRRRRSAECRPCRGPGCEAQEKSRHGRPRDPGSSGEGLILVGVLADDESGGFLVEVRAGERHLQPAGRRSAASRRRSVLFLEAGLVAKAAVVGRVQADPEASFFAFPRRCEPHPAPGNRCRLRARRRSRDLVRHRRNNVDDPVHRARAIEDAAGPAQDLDRGGLLEGPRKTR